MLIDLSERERRTSKIRLPLIATALEYSAAIDVFDGSTPGHTTVRWTATFDAPDVATPTITALRDIAFADFTEQLGQQVRGRARTDLAS